MRNLPGYVRGFDVRTGKQLWKFNLVPEPGEFGADTWLNGSKLGTPGVGKNDAWATYSADPELGLVYIPVGMPLMDEYGGHRPGNNLFGNSLVALDVKTGKRKWHFQMVHHDIWDYDAPMAPNLLDVTIDGTPRKIIAQSTKQGWLYVFDRVTGEPIWPIVETPVLASEVPGEQASPTQPIPSKPAPYAQQGLVEADLIDYTPAIKDSALKLAKRVAWARTTFPASPGDGTAPSGLTCSWYAPGASGGVNIDGGAAVDPETGLLYVAAQNGLSTMQLLKDPCSEFRYSSPHDSCGQLGALPPPPGYQKSDGRGGGRTVAANNIGGVSIVKPKELGGITAYNMSSGRQGVVDPERRATAAGRDQGSALCGRDAAAGGSGPGAGADHHDQDPGDLRHRARWRAAEREAADLRRRQGDGQAGRRGRHPVAHERGADDVHAQGAAVHRLCHGSRREHVARRVESAEVARVRPPSRRLRRTRNRGEHHV